jgi:Peptidase family M48
MRVIFRAFAAAVCLFLISDFSFARNLPKLNEVVELPASFDIDFKIASTQRHGPRPNIDMPRSEADAVGAAVFQNLVRTQMVLGLGLPYRWTFNVENSPSINAASSPDGEVMAYAGTSRLIGTNRGLWAAVLSHEIAHVIRRHGVQKYLYAEYIRQQVEYWQRRSRLGDKHAIWVALGLQIAGNLAEKKLSRDLEHDADIQGMLLMARAGYHPDNVFALHHLLRMATGEQSKFGTFFFSDHPRWQTRDQRSDKAYVDALAEYTSLFPDATASPGGDPPAVAFIDNVRGIENKLNHTGDLALSLSCRNMNSPVTLAVRLTHGNHQPVKSRIPEYADSLGNVLIRDNALCSEKENADTTTIHLPSALIADEDRKVEAQIDLLSSRGELLEQSKLFDVRFPKVKNGDQQIAKVKIEPELSATTKSLYIKNDSNNGSVNLAALVPVPSLSIPKTQVSELTEANIKPLGHGSIVDVSILTQTSDMTTRWNTLNDPALIREEALRRSWWPVNSARSQTSTKAMLSVPNISFSVQSLSSASSGRQCHPYK